MKAFSETVPAACDAQRIDRVVALVSEVSRSHAARWVAQGRVRLDGSLVTNGAHRVAAGQTLTIEPPEPADPRPAADGSVPFEVVFCDDHVIVVDKPAGISVHPGIGHAGGTLVNGLLARYPEIGEVGDPARPGIVHRLDRTTSGLLVIARTPVAYESLAAQLREHEPERVYTALVWGHPGNDKGVISAPIGRSLRQPTRMTVTELGKPALTRYEVNTRFSEPQPLALLTCRLETGRTHQIRVHLDAIGHPVVGDRNYGGARGQLDPGRPFLHARALSFRHPLSGRTISSSTPLPTDLSRIASCCS